MIKFKKLHPNAIIPEYQTDGSSGFDLHALEWTQLNSHNGITLVRTGLAVEIPERKAFPMGFAITDVKDLLFIYFELQIRPRSGLSLKGIMIPNSPGTIDADYRGEIKIPMLIAHQDIRPFADQKTALSMPYIYDIQAGDRVAQGIVSISIRPVIVEVDQLSETKRGSNGFGSTG